MAVDVTKYNKEQTEAITFGEGPLLIIAGAGTGKTTVITERVKHLILEKNVRPDEILALTFTEKACTEMEDRIDKIMPYGYTQMWIETFHSFCDLVLRTESINIGLNPNYKLMTEAESILFLRKNIFNLNLNYYKPLGNPTKFLEALLEHFSRLRDEDISPSQYIEYTDNLSHLQTTNEVEQDSQFSHLDKTPNSTIHGETTALQVKVKEKLNAKRYELNANSEEILKTLELANTYKMYEELKVKEGVMDFSDLIANTLLLFRSRKNILARYQNQFKYILVDEFQDTNYAQNELAILLAAPKNNIAVVADDDQAIYRWRGAALSNVLQFKKNFPGAKTITLIRNYRSNQLILDSAYKLIQFNNPNRLEIMENVSKKLRAERRTKGKAIEFIRTTKSDEEAEAIAKRILEYTDKEKYNFSDIAILTRANNHAQIITRALQRYKIPYQFLGPGQLFHQEEIKDLISYLKVLYNPDDTISLFRVLNMDIFKFSAREINYVLNMTKRKNISLFEAIGATDDTFLKDETKLKLAQIREMVLKHMELTKKETAGQILYYFLIDSGLYKHLAEYKTDRQEKVAQNIAKFFEKLKNHEIDSEDSGIYAVVDWIELMMQVGESPLATGSDWRNFNAVSILTVHSSKGLEFPVVFLVNLVSNRFPSTERREKIPVPQELVKEILPEVDYHMQEERRLFYVGMTRAKDELVLTASGFYGEGKRERKISPFITEVLGESILRKNRELKNIQQLSFIDIMKEYEEQTIIQEKPVSRRISSISYTHIQAFDICPLHYKARYILNLPTLPSAALSYGVSIHETLQELYGKLKQGVVLSVEDLILVLKEKWRTDGYLNKIHEEEMFNRGKEMLKKYMIKHFDTQRVPLLLETPFSFNIARNSDDTQTAGSDSLVRVTGKIDRIDRINENSIEIIDYKTGKPDGTSKYSYRMQLGMYTLAATKMNNQYFGKSPKEITVTLFYVEEDEKVSQIIKPEDLQKVELDIINKVNEIENSDFACSRNLLCANCEYKMLCNINI